MGVGLTTRISATGTLIGLVQMLMALDDPDSIGPAMAVALLIPFTFQMEPASSLIMLGAVYTSTVAGGAVSGILVNIPGAPANIATIMDGHPMANQGRATEALHYCFISSLVGGLIGVLLLIFFTPMLAELALRFQVLQAAVPTNCQMRCDVFQAVESI